MRNKYTKEFKQRIVKKHEEGCKVKTLCREFNLNKNTVYLWINLYQLRTDNKGNTFTYKDYLDLQKQLAAKSREIEIIKNAKCFEDTPRKEKLKAIESLFGQYSVSEMCRVLNVDHSTFYNYHFRRVKKTQYEIHDEFLKPKIKEIFEKSGNRFGMNKIHAKLKEQGIRTSPEKISKLMKDMGLKPQLIKMRSFFPKENLANFKNKLKREFSQSSPNVFWVGDITATRVNGQKYYICAIIDLFSRKVIGIKVSNRANIELVTNTLMDAFETRDKPQSLTFHSDRGSQYTSYEYMELLQSLNIEQSFSNTGNPYDNAVIESFFSNLKKEELNRKYFITLSELKESLNSYIEFYNDYRPHETLGNITPNQYEERYYAITENRTVY